MIAARKLTIARQMGKITSGHQVGSTAGKPSDLTDHRTGRSVPAKEFVIMAQLDAATQEALEVGTEDTENDESRKDAARAICLEIAALREAVVSELGMIVSELQDMQIQGAK